MPAEILDGLRVTVLGMGTVFAVLAILLVSIQILDRLFRPKAVESAEAGEQPEVESQTSPPSPEQDDEEQVAAIAVAMALALEVRHRSMVTFPRTGSPKGSEDDDVPWRLAGRQRLMDSRSLKR